MSDCLFCKIVRGEIPCDKVYEDSNCIVFRDKFPKAPVHVLVVPKKHIVSLRGLTPEDSVLMGDLVCLLPKIANDLGLVTGFRTIVNTDKGGGQEVFHLHFHIIGGTKGTLPGF